MRDTLRPYGPGKFHNMLDAYVYSLSLNGCDDETGDVGEVGHWYGLLKGFNAADISATATCDGAITPDEVAYLLRHVGAIVHEDSQGFVSVDYHANIRALEAAWVSVVHAIAQYETADEDGETGDGL